MFCEPWWSWHRSKEHRYGKVTFIEGLKLLSWTFYLSFELLDIAGKMENIQLDKEHRVCFNCILTCAAALRDSDCLIISVTVLRLLFPTYLQPSSNRFHNISSLTGNKVAMSSLKKSLHLVWLPCCALCIQTLYPQNDTASYSIHKPGGLYWH